MKTILGWVGIFLCGAIPVRCQVPSLLSYQGRISASGTNFNGVGQFKFALVNATGTETSSTPLVTATLVCRVRVAS